MSKQLSKLALAELGIEGMLAGKLYAFVGRYVGPGPMCGLGIAVANEPGYYPVPINRANAESFDEASDMAEELNREILGINETAAARIVCSSMAAGKVGAP